MINDKYITTIGLEVHIQLKTKQKIFCLCPVLSSSENVLPNSASCPVCKGQPGVLPSLNAKVVELAILFSLALKCEIQNTSIFDRKHYCYPDLPKNFQITQNFYSLGKNGKILISNGRHIEITKIHMEEDAAKLSHRKEIGKTFVDFNRAGVPLIEVVSEPTINNPEEAGLYLQKMQNLARWFNVSNADMENGEIRCDGNISVMPKSFNFKDSVKWEIKNLNSIKSLVESLKEAEKRQIYELEYNSGIPEKDLKQETFGWDSKSFKLLPQRNKETLSDYFYFPEPDLQDLELSHTYIESISNKSIEHIDDIEKKLCEMGLQKEYIEILTHTYERYQYFYNANKIYMSPITISKILTQILFPFVSENKYKNNIFSENIIAQLAEFIDKKELLLNNVEKVFKFLIENPKTQIDVSKAIEVLGLKLVIIKNEDLEKLIMDVLKENEKQFLNYCSGQSKVFGYFMGEIMKKLGNNKPSPQSIKPILELCLNKLSGEKKEP